MCAGATVFTAMTNYDVKPTDRIGIVGIGGLGHLGLQFARAWGCHVVAISTNSVSYCNTYHGECWNIFHKI
jgi:alcohol/geraniol dehydrogenase (NADP+)